MADLEDSAAPKKAKAGRRAGQERDEEKAEPEKKHKGGWDVGPTKEQQEAAIREEEKRFEEKYFGDADGENVVSAGTSIPVLDGSPTQEGGGDDETMLRQVAEAPRNYNTHVQGLPDLEKENASFLPSTGDEQIDISILTQAICENREEEDAEWVPDVLFQQLASELQAEREAKTSKTEATSPTSPNPVDEI
eukprot:Sspe_Gene.13546::Locus_4635_Transcript_1_1_Confidence_1.000_Length_837::g.13546::m.13546/K19675/IFT43; intraflagellar transport protein 43